MQNQRCISTLRPLPHAWYKRRRVLLPAHQNKKGYHMRCHVTSALALAAQTFRILRALKEATEIKKYFDPEDTIKQVVDYLATKRPGIAPYDTKIVQNELQRLIQLGLVRERVLLTTSCGNELVELTMTSTDPQFERYQQWYSPEKLSQAA